MTDRRLLPSNGRVAEVGWEDRVSAQTFVDGAWRSVVRPVADLLQAPEGKRDRQLLRGDRFLVLEDRNGFSFGRAGKDGYVGYLQSSALHSAPDPTHIVGVRATHEYVEADIKASDVGSLSFGSRVCAVHELRDFVEIDGGTYLPKRHVRPLDQPFRDPVTVAQLFFGTPYLWGGNSAFGIDCSGLVQAGLLACGQPCPGDSDMQRSLGAPLEEHATLQRGDLVFWPGHVAIAVDSDIFLHANAHNMAVVYEGIEDTINRIAAQGEGEVLARRRP